ncbi:HPr family phosphocarrier protein [uncultured Cellulomonas sp.]|uniref:HPr family phosphocarrier protein n=1 Tax=uncultured Cellulomonas sp. TaxID=189682 RepID=UPI00262E4A64|nr:HPr family phosphocarrier protein [uncultured Cellulomonas sp.]
MPQRRVTVAIPEGLHARPAALFVKLAGEQPAAVTIAKDGGDPVAASSILAVMTLGAGAGDDVVLAADGDGAEDSLDALEQYLTTAEH